MSPACSIAGRVTCITPKCRMSDVVDKENNRPESKVPVTEKIRANVCDPDTITLEEQVNTVCAFVAAHPKEHGRSADMLVQLAMQAKWPCPAR